MPMYTFTTIDNPAANGVTVAVDINNADQIVGYYIDAAMKSHGFLLSGGVFTTLDDPFATTLPASVSTLAQYAAQAPISLRRFSNRSPRR